MRTANTIGFTKNGTVMLATLYNPQLVEAIKAIPGRRWNSEGYVDGCRMSKYWTLPADCDKRALVALAREYDMQFVGFESIDEYESRYAS